MTAKLWICTGYWKDDEEPFTGMVACDGEWDGAEDAIDGRIFMYTDGAPVVGVHTDCVITDAVEYTPDWWGNKQTNWAKANEAFYAWEKLHYEDDSELSDDDREIWVEGYLQALRDAT
jgi:hypothetical protein